MADSSGEKSEAPTQKRLKDARKKGEAAKSNDLVTVGVLLAATLGLRWVGPDIWDFMLEGLHQGFANQTGEDLTPGRVAEMGRNAATGMALALAPFFAILAVAAIVFNVGQTGPMLTGQKLAPKMSHVSPLSGFKRIYSMDGLVNLGRTVFKMGIVSFVVAFTLYQRMEEITFLGQYPVAHAVGVIAGICFDIALRTSVILFLLTIADYFWQRYQFFKRQKMTKDEVRREHKESEGDPQVKAALRRKRQAMLNRMIAAVPNADVVVTNPTHYAVALKYDPGSMAAPTVVAKGERLTAQRIKDVARRAGVPVLEEPPLARALFAAVDIGSPIPANLYQAVAEVLAWVYSLREQARKATQSPVGASQA